MSTTKTFTNITSGKRYQIDATAQGYYDFRTTVVPQPNKPLSYTMKVYDGLNYTIDLSKNSVRLGEINFDDTILPYIENNTLTKTNYCFGNSGTNYNLPVYNKEYTNVEMNGNPTIIDGMVSNFSSENYLKFLRNKFTNNNELIFKFKLNTIKNCAIFHCEFFLSVEISGTSLICYNWQQSTAQTILDSVETNKWYWVKVEITDLATRKYSISTDGVTYIEKLSTVDTSAVLTYQSYDYMYIGNSSFNTSDNAVDGFIDLNESTIVAGEVLYNLKEFMLYPQYTGYTLEGNASINGSICSGFNSSSKVILNNVNFTNEKDIIVGFTTASDVTTAQKIFEYQDDGISFQIVDGKIQYWTKDNKLWHDYETVEANNSYKLKITITSNTSYTLGFMNVNDSDYNNIDVTDTSLTVGKNLTFYIGTNSDSFYKPFQGTIDIGGIPGAYEVKTESKVGIFYNYEDTGLDVKLNCFSKSNEFVVLSSDESITDYTYLGKVNIPEHKISYDKPSTPDTPTIDPSSLKFGDRIDNKAIVVGTFESNDNKSYVVAVLDSAYYADTNWASDLSNKDPGLPEYDLADGVPASLESATYNTDYILNNHSGKLEAFQHCRNTGTLTFNDQLYKFQLPNILELKLIYDNKDKLYELDPTTSTNTVYNLANWEFTESSMAWTSNVCDASDAWALDEEGDFGPVMIMGDDKLAVIPIIEIPLSK